MYLYLKQKKMLFYLFFLVVMPLISSFDLPHDKCNISTVNIDNNYYNLSQTIYIGEAYPADLHYDVYGNMFYVKSAYSPKKGFSFDIYMIKANNLTPLKVQGLPQGLSYSVAVDNLYSDTYFGTQRGIFRFNYEKCRAELDSSEKLRPAMMFIDRDGNKYITESYNGIEELYILDGEKKIRYNILQSMNELAIDDKNNFYYIKEGQLFELKRDSLKPRYIGNVDYNGIAQLTYYNGYVFVASQTLSFFRGNGQRQLKKVENLPKKVSAIAFDKEGNFVLGTYGKLMKYSKINCYFRY